MPRRSAPPQCAAARVGGRRNAADRATEPLFASETPADAPLAARMRPQTLDEFVGQPHLVGDEGALTRVVRPGYLPSMVLWGPPGSGKTTLARLLAERSRGTWRQISAVTSGVADIRQLVADARQLRDAGGRTVVFIDELHRFNKAQQDALLPHFEAASAFIKSMRGNDPDAALYWCASMIAAGEDPTFIARRIVIAASEDVGNADPRALQVAVSAMQAVEMIGLPEAQYALAQAAAYVASAPKSNRAGGAYFSALDDVEEKGRLPVPLHLRPAAHRRLTREYGYGKGYLYPHDYEGADVEQQYLPDALA